MQNVSEIVTLKMSLHMGHTILDLEGIWHLVEHLRRVAIFDLVTHEPDIYADNRKIMERGRVLVPEPQVF